MRGYFSRGHEPDAARGQAYRRVLLQMGRPVLDSDVAAGTEALLGGIRAVDAGLVGPAGSPDLGFVVTPGRLLAAFGRAAGVTAPVGQPDVWVDYRYRFVGRWPALYLAAPASGPATVRIPLVQRYDPSLPLDQGITLWTRVEQEVILSAAGQQVTLKPALPDVPREVTVQPAGPISALDVQLPPGGAVWLFLAEQTQIAGAPFWVTPGTYNVDGLVVSTGGGPFPPASFPEQAGFGWAAGVPPLQGLVLPDDPVAGSDLVVAYLEVHERHLTYVEDPGIREGALGGLDTTTRGQLVGQVKLALTSGLHPTDTAMAARQASAAFDTTHTGDGPLTVAVAAASGSRDPCAIGTDGGYTGGENRLYRFEVHRGGALGQVRLVWARDNASTLVAARIPTDPSGATSPSPAGRGDTLRVDASAPLAPGDLVEVLSSVIDLGDDTLATVRLTAGGASAFTPASGAVGQLARLVTAPADDASDQLAFALVDPDTDAALTLDGRYGDHRRAALKLRRWDGLIDPGQLAGPGGTATAGPHAVEDDLTVLLDANGDYRPGQWWAYEARAGQGNANGPWRPRPHGPERRFAPLALLRFVGPGQPMPLVAWLDRRFAPLAALDADRVDYDGGRAGTSADTVQEALDALFNELGTADCGELVIRPDNDPGEIFDQVSTAGDARICFQPGTWTVRQTIEVADKGDLVISGAGAATRLVADGIDTVLRFVRCGRVSVRDLAIDGGAAGISDGGFAPSLAVTQCADVELERLRVSCGSAPTRRMSAIQVGSSTGEGRATIRGCDVRAGHAQVGIFVLGLATAVLEGNRVTSPALPFDLREQSATPTVLNKVGKMLIDTPVFGTHSEVPNDFLLGGDNIMELPATSGRQHRILAYLQQWGNQYITFTSDLATDAEGWRQLLVGNPIPGPHLTDPSSTAPSDWLRAGLRRLRAQLVKLVLVGITAPDPIDPGGHNVQAIEELGNQLVVENPVTAGGQGIVVTGQGTGIDPLFPQPRWLPEPRPDVRITGNEITGFAAGIKVAAGQRHHGHRMTHRVTIQDNTVYLTTPSLAAHHGILVANAYQLQIRGNTVEIREPGPPGWDQAGGRARLLQRLPGTAGIRVAGAFGPLIQLRDNLSVGTYYGVVATASNTGGGSPATGWSWLVADNSHVVGSSNPVINAFGKEVRNW